MDYFRFLNSWLLWQHLSSIITQKRCTEYHAFKHITHNSHSSFITTSIHFASLDIVQCHLTFALPLKSIVTVPLACLFALGNRLFVQSAGRGMSASVWKVKRYRSLPNTPYRVMFLCCINKINSIAVTYDFYTINSNSAT